MNLLKWKMVPFALVTLAYVWVCGQSFAQQRDYFHSTPKIQKYALIIGGAAAEDTYRERFQKWTLELYETLVKEYRYPLGHVTLLLGNGDLEDTRISGPAHKEAILETLSTLQNQVQPGDQIFFFLVGHGTSDQEEAKYNIVGPDITGGEFATMLHSFSKQDLVVVNTTSSSFPFSVSLSSPGRILISATRSSAEKYDTVFAEFFVEALKNHAGDYDKNTRLSLWEAFQYAKKRTEKWYVDQERLPTEHPVLDDNADAVFSADPNPAENDGRLAQVATFDLLSIALPKDIPFKTSEKIKTLTAKMLELERSVLLLRNRKTELLKSDYQQQLEVLLIDLARTTRQLRTLEKTLELKR